MKPQIVAKSACIHENIKVKELIGCDGIEIQLLNDFYKHPVIEPYVDIITKHEKVIAIHAPIIGTGDNCLSSNNVEYMFQYSIHALNNLCFLAQQCAEKLGHNISVILHIEHSYAELVYLNLYDDLKNYIYSILISCPNISILFENVTPLSHVDMELIRTTNNFLFDNVCLVHQLVLDDAYGVSDRLGTVLDLCHAEMSIEFCNILAKNFGDEICIPEYTLEDYFQQNQKYCDLIHLAKKVGHGTTDETHGQPMSTEDKQLLTNYMNLYKKYDYSCPIVLEVKETDYLKCDGYRNTKDLLEEVLK